MTNIPAPLTPPDCDLRGFDNLQLDVDLLPKSKLANYAEAEAFRAAVLLWCEAWKQVPAASLPDDDLELRAMVGLQRDAETWARIKKDALSKFIKCSDGRLYHEVLAEKANEAWLRRLDYRERAKAGGKASAKARAKAAGEPAGSPQENEGEGEGEGDSGLPDGKPNEARKRATRLSEDFQIPEEWTSYGLDGGLTKAEISLLFEELKTWSLTKKQGTSLDWRRTWQTWCRRHKAWGVKAAVPESVSRETIWPDDPEERERAEALQRRVGKNPFKSYFAKAPPRKNCDGWVVFVPNSVVAPKVENQYGNSLDEIYGRKGWRIEVAP